MKKHISIYVETPFCSFRPFLSREYQETYSFPPPSTVYGMLLSLIGVDWNNKSKFQGVRMALALEKEPDRSRILRKFRRVVQYQTFGKDELADRRPDFQDVLVDLRLWVWIEDHEAENSLVGAITAALDTKMRRKIDRYGGLSLGESANLVNDISIRDPEGKGRYLVEDDTGALFLTTWVSHPREGSERALKKRFSITDVMDLRTPPPGDKSWILVAPEKASE